MQYIIDRIEGAFAVCEDENRDMHTIPLEALPFEAKEGLRFEDVDGSYQLIEGPDERAEAIRRLMDALWD